MSESLNDLARRICNYRDCPDCPLHELKQKADGDCVANRLRFMKSTAQEQIDKMREWAEENPVEEKNE